MKQNSITLFNYCRSFVVGVSALAISFCASAQGAISAVSASVQGGSETVKIDFTDFIPALPTGFATQLPARIALDFYGVDNSSGKSLYETNLGNLRSVSIVQAGERSRVVLNLKVPAAYKTDIRGKSLFISLDPAIGSSGNSETSTTFAEGQNSNILPLRDIDFRRGSDGAGRIVVNLANNQVGVNLQQHRKVSRWTSCAPLFLRGCVAD